jgi:hypothetical protein
VRHFISAMTLTDAGHGDVLGLQRKGECALPLGELVSLLRQDEVS